MEKDKKRNLSNKKRLYLLSDAKHFATFFTNEYDLEWNLHMIKLSSYLKGVLIQIRSLNLRSSYSLWQSQKLYNSWKPSLV